MGKEAIMKNWIKYALVCLVIFTALSFAHSSGSGELIELARNYRKAHEYNILQEYFELLAIPNISSDHKNIRLNAEFIEKMLEKRGVNARILETDGNPVVYGEKITSEAKQTLLLYVHYDGQPVDPSHWVDSQPFQPVLRPGKLDSVSRFPKPVSLSKGEGQFDDDWRIYARSASDDKAPLIALCAALDALQDAGIPLKNNLKFIFEGEEEAGSTNLFAFLEEHRDLLEADVLFMCDGPAYYSGAPILFFGVRGILTIEIKVYGANTSLHSGHYGNWAPNPAMMLAQLLASMKDETGKVLVEGFYDTCIPLSVTEKEAIKAIPSYEYFVKKNFGFSGEESGDASLLEAIQYPSLNIHGLQSGWVGDQARTIIPPFAETSIDVRLVKGNDADDMLKKIVNHIKGKGYHVVNNDPDLETRMRYKKIVKISSSGGGYKASRTSMDLPVSRSVTQSLTEHGGTMPVMLPSLGGSLPIYVFDQTLGIPTIGIAVVNYDNNQHQPNENLRIGHLWNAIETFTAVIMMKDVKD